MPEPTAPTLGQLRAEYALAEREVEAAEQHARTLGAPRRDGRVRTVGPAMRDLDPLAPHDREVARVRIVSAKETLEAARHRLAAAELRAALETLPEAHRALEAALATAQRHPLLGACTADRDPWGRPLVSPEDATAPELTVARSQQLLEPIRAVYGLRADLRRMVSAQTLIATAQVERLDALAAQHTRRADAAVVRLAALERQRDAIIRRMRGEDDREAAE